MSECATVSDSCQPSMAMGPTTSQPSVPIRVPSATNKVYGELATIPKLGKCTIPSPIEAEHFITDDHVVFRDVCGTVDETVTIPITVSNPPSDQAIDQAQQGQQTTNTTQSILPTILSRVSGHFDTYEHAGPRSHIFFDPTKTTMALVTCGGLCPGMNNVIRGIVLCAWHRYGVKNIIGLKYGFQGLNPEISERIQLTPQVVKDIHRFGGTLLGTSRGPQPVPVMAEFLIQNKIDILFVIGGDGSARGCQAIAQELVSRKAAVSIILIPKTIDNDIVCTDRTFGFETAVDLAQRSITAAHGEARSVENGIGIVKLMGRESGFIALHAALASGDANLVLIPEVPFTIDGIVRYLQNRFKQSNHCVIVVAEGAGQNTIVPKTGAVDKSGNPVLTDIGVYIKEQLEHRLKQLKIPTTIKYIDPSYTIRCAVVDAADAVFCLGLAHGGVHAAVTGRTGMVVSHLNGHFVHVPLHVVADRRKFVDPRALEYQLMLDLTGQPKSML